MTEKSPISLEMLFARWVLDDLERAKCRNEQLAAVVRGTVGTTIAFLRTNRRTALAGNPTACQLAEQEFGFENRLLRSVFRALPPPRKRGRKKGQNDPDTLKKFWRICELKGERKNWKQIESTVVSEFGPMATVDAYKKIFKRHLPYLVKEWRRRFQPGVPEQEFLKSALSAAKGKPGRPKSRQNLLG